MPADTFYAVIPQYGQPVSYLSEPILNSASVVRTEGEVLRLNEAVVADVAELGPLLCVVGSGDGGVSRQVPFVSRRCATQIAVFEHANGGPCTLCATTKGLGTYDCGLVLEDLYLEDGRAEDPRHDPVGGYLTQKALREYDALTKCLSSGVLAETALGVLDLGLSTSEGFPISLLIKGGRTNMRLDMLTRLGDSDRKLLKRAGITAQSVSNTVVRSLGRCHRKAGICHGSPYEDNISIVGELCDFEYAEPFTKDGAWRDLWYAVWALAEVFGPEALDVATLVREYAGDAVAEMLPSAIMKVTSADECKELASVVIGAIFE
jgi:hypothetical protein